MVESDRFVLDSTTEGTTPFKIIGLASTLVSSLILVWYDGVADVVYAIFSLPADLLSALLSWVNETLGLVFEVPEESMIDAWEEAATFFPVAGALDWVLGVLLVIGFFWATKQILGRIVEGL